MITLNFQQLVMEGFRSFKHRQVFQLGREPGLYFVTGKNLNDNRLGTNAAGKTTIFDAITWCLFGKTIRGSRGSVIKNWTSTTCSVSLDFNRGDESYNITRTQNPNSLSITPPIWENGTPKEIIVQSDIDNLLNIDYEKFLYTVIIGQFNSSFLDLGPTDKLDLFSDIMSLSFWEQCAKEASEKVTHLENSSKLLEAQKNGIQNSLSSLQSEEEAFTAKLGAWENTSKVEIQQLKVQVKEIVDVITKAFKEEKLYTHQLAQINLSLEDDIVRINENISIINENISSFSTLLKLAEISKRNQTNELTKWKNLDTCPYCKQTVEETVISKYRTNATKELLSINKDIKNNKQKIIALEEQLNINKEKLAEVKIKYSEQREIITSWNRLLTTAQTTKELKTKELKNLNTRIESLKTDINPFIDILSTIKNNSASTQEKLTIINDRITEINKEILGNQYWIKGFKELRLWVVSDALLALEIEANNAGSKLGLNDWKLRFQMERETSTGSISKGFHVLVSPPKIEDDTYIPFETWSGGETQRLKLASVVGLSELIQNYKGINFNIGVWDEPTSFLSEEGIEELINFLQEEAKTKKKAIFFIDQRHLEGSQFKEVIKVEKSKEGSKIIE